MDINWTQDDVSIDGIRLHYYRKDGRGKKPLVLVHGFSDNGLCWATTARELAADYDVIMPDMRGHGLSARVQSGEQVDMAADLEGFIHALGLKRPVIIGHSMGAMVAYQLCVRRPMLASALVLEDPPWWVTPPGFFRPDFSNGDPPIIKWVKELPQHSLEELIDGYRRDHPAWPDELIRPMCESKKQLDPAIADIMMKKVNPPEVDWLTTLSNVTLPFLIFAGDPQRGGILTPEAVSKIRELNSSVTVIVVPGVGHLIRFDNHPVFMAGLKEFLKRVPCLASAPEHLTGIG